MQKDALIKLFNGLEIAGMAEVTELHELRGDFINLEYTLPGGQAARLWDDNKTYLGAEMCKHNSDRCYGLTADENYLLVCEYGENGTNAEIIIFKKYS